MKDAGIYTRANLPAIGTPLTDRELQIVGTILDGNTTYVQIAAVLVLSVRTVQTHLQNIYAKCGANNMTDVVLMCLGRRRCAVDLSGVMKKVK